MKTTNLPTIIINSEKLSIKIESYRNKRPAILAFDSDGAQYDVLSVNLPDWPAGKDEVFIDTNNHRGAEKALQEAGIIGRQPVDYGQSGFCEYPLYKLQINKT